MTYDRKQWHKQNFFLFYMIFSSLLVFMCMINKILGYFNRHYKNLLNWQLSYKYNQLFIHLLYTNTQLLIFFVFFSSSSCLSTKRNILLTNCIPLQFILLLLLFLCCSFVCQLYYFIFIVFIARITLDQEEARKKTMFVWM